MDDEVKFAVLLGRLVDLVRRAPDAVDDHKAALRALTELANRRGATIRREEYGLTVDGAALPAEAPFVSLLKTRMQAHYLAEIRLHHGASAMDVLDLVRAIALEPAQYRAGHDVQDILRREQVQTVSVMTMGEDEATHGRRTTRITDALEASRLGSDAPPPPQLGVLPGRGAYEEMVHHQRAATGTLAGAVEGLRRHKGGAGLAIKLEAFHAGVAKALDAKEDVRALEGIVQLIAEEAGAPEGEVRRLLSVTLRRVLTSQVLQRLARQLLDEVYADDAAAVMRRAGSAGTKVLLDLLVEAPTFAERRAYLVALRQVEEGTDVVWSLLNHHQWFVVRNAADLAGELRIADAVGALGKAVSHDDARVRRSVGMALARIGTPGAVQFLARLLRDADPDVRLAAVREAKGKGLSALSMPLVTVARVEEDPELVTEYYRALGRIGTPDAVQALAQVAQRSGGLLRRRKGLEPRLAAIEGLALAGGEAAQAVLGALRNDRVKEVRAAAGRALEAFSGA